MPLKIYINIVKISLKNPETSQISYTAKPVFEIWEWGKMHLEYKLKSNQQKESQIFADIDPKSASKNHQLIDQYLQYINVASSLFKKSNH